jgi:hypothetical protein
MNIITSVNFITWLAPENWLFFSFFGEVLNFWLLFVSRQKVRRQKKYSIYKNHLALNLPTLLSYCFCFEIFI